MKARVLFPVPPQNSDQAVVGIRVSHSRIIPAVGGVGIDQIVDGVSLLICHYLLNHHRVFPVPLGTEL